MTIVQSESVATGITRIAINRPEKRNAVSPEVRDALIDTFSNALNDEDVQAIVLGSTDGHFCAGGDIDTMVEMDVSSGRTRMKENHRMVRLLAEAEKPIVAAVEGYAVGAGAGIALLCDSIVITKGGTLGFPFFRIGLTPDYGILFTLAYLIASILPSVPLLPNPPGIRTPDTFFNNGFTISGFTLSESILFKLTFTLFDMPP